MNASTFSARSISTPGRKKMPHSCNCSASGKPMRFCCLAGLFVVLTQTALLTSHAAGAAQPANNAKTNSPDTERIGIALEALERLKGTDVESNPAVKKAVLD